MNKRLPSLLLVLPALLLLGGCALEPSYRYNANAGGGYYYGQSPYGNADTVIQGNVYAQPWGYGPWGAPYGGGYGYSGWGVGFGFTPWGGYGYPYFDAYGRYRYRSNYRRYDQSTRRTRPANLPPPVRAVRKAPSRRAIPARSNNQLPQRVPIGAMRHSHPMPMRAAPVPRMPRGKSGSRDRTH